MKPQPLIALSAFALCLLAGCAAPQAASLPTPSAPPTTSQDAPKSITIDLAGQTMTIPDTQFGTTTIPILALGDVLGGTSVITAEPSGMIPFVHCQDRTVAWGAEPNTQGAGAWARPLQILTFDPACTDIASISGHPIVVPRVVSENEGAYGVVDQWLSEGREVIVVGKSPHPDPNIAPAPNVEWPDKRPVFLRSSDPKS